MNCTRTDAELEQNIWEEISVVPIEIMWYIMGSSVPRYKNAFTCMEEVVLVVLFLKI